LLKLSPCETPCCETTWNAFQCLWISRTWDFAWKLGSCGRSLVHLWVTIKHQERLCMWFPQHAKKGRVINYTWRLSLLSIQFFPLHNINNYWLFLQIFPLFSSVLLLSCDVPVMVMQQVRTNTIDIHIYIYRKRERFR
jgi:hypothetical protein